MQLPPEVREFIEEKAGQFSTAELRRACEALSAYYRGQDRTTLIQLDPELRVIAYLVLRLPATYAAAYCVAEELVERYVDCKVKSLLDLGAGPGAASLAARELFPALARLTLVESDPAMGTVAKELLPEANLVTQDLASLSELPEHDLVVAAYVLGEAPEKLRKAIVARAWRATQVALAVLEPGSRKGFEVIRQARDELLELGAHILAPCPAEGTCPVARPDWCHFGARVERIPLQRRMKGAKLGYEDEKFSYLLVTREEGVRARQRIIRRPEHGSGVVRLVLCDGERIRHERLVKRHPLYKKARQARWGDDLGELEKGREQEELGEGS